MLGRTGDSAELRSQTSATDTEEVIGVKALRGYLLEEVVARMLRDNGYRLLSDLQDDTDALVEKKGALYVRGRGSDHQADALGDLLTPIPFGLPVRLFVEAKFYSQRVDLPVLRNAHGVIHDVNQCYATATGARATQRYDYRYAVFSTSGFTSDADDFAKAHQISLHDLSGDSAAPLRRQIETTASGLLAAVTAAGLTTFPLNAVRLALRAVLGTLDLAGGGEPEAASAPASALRAAGRRLPALACLLERLPAPRLWAVVEDLAVEASRWRFLVGYPDGRSVLALRPDDVGAFTRHCRAVEDAHIDVAIHYAPGRRRGRGEYVVAPLDAGAHDFRLYFGVPDIVVREVLTVPEPRTPGDSAPSASTITVFHDQRTVRLSYIPKQVPPEAGRDAASVAQWWQSTSTIPTPEAGDDARHDEAPTDGTGHEDPHDDDAGPAGEDDPEPDADAWERWTAPESRLLQERLDERGSTRAGLLLDLAVARRRGMARDDVLASIGRAPGGHLQGVINPVVSALRALQREGLLREELRCPVLARRRRGLVRSYRLADEVRRALRPVAKDRLSTP